MASITAGGSFIFSNLLDELEMNPTWEKFRKYVYAVCAVVSLYPLYLALGLPVECQAAYSNGTIKCDAASSKYSNVYCQNDNSLIAVRYSGCFLLLANVFILVASFYWLHLPKVIATIRNFADVRSRVLALNLPLSSLKDLLSKPESASNSGEKENENRQKLREACRLLHFVNRSNDVCKHYVWRNIALLAVLFFCLAGSVALSVLIGQVGDTFMCDCNVGDCEGLYKCAFDDRVSTLLFTASYAVGLLLQGVLVVYGISRTKPSGKWLGRSSSNLMLKFCEHSQPLLSGLLSNVVKYVLSDEFHVDIGRNMPAILKKKDAELIKVVELLTERSPSVIFKHLESPIAEFSEERYMFLIERCKYSVVDCVELARLFAKHNLWKLFVKLLEFADSKLSTCDDEVKRHFRGMKINFDNIETPAVEVSKLIDDTDAMTDKVKGTFDGKSVLYHAIMSPKSRDKGFEIATFLLNACKPGQIYVHCEVQMGLSHVSTTAENFVDEHSAGVSPEVVTKLKDEIQSCQSSGNYQNSQVSDLQYMKYGQLFKKPRQPLNQLAVILARKKFRMWDENALKFMSLASENRHNIVGQSILRAVYSVSPIRCLDMNVQSLPNKEIFDNAITKFQYTLDDCKNVIRHCVKNKYWQALTLLLNYVTSDLTQCSPRDITFFKSLEIDLDSLETATFAGEEEVSLEDSKSLLHYAFEQNRDHRQPALVVANLLLKISKNQKLYIHKGFSSFHAINHVETCAGENVFNKSMLIELMHGFESRAVGAIQIPCQQGVGALYEKYKNLDNLGGIAMEELDCCLSRAKLHIWDDNVKKFAKLAAKNKHWKIIISLLNAVIETNDYNISKGFLHDSIDITFLKDEEIWECIVVIVHSNREHNLFVEKPARYVIRKCLHPARHDIISRLQQEKDGRFNFLQSIARSLT